MYISSQQKYIHQWVTYYKLRKPKREEERSVYALPTQKLFCKKCRMSLGWSL